MDAVEPDDIEVGMIVAVDHRAEGHFFDGGYVVHRVLRTEDRGGELWVSTKGDNNKVADGFVPIEDVVARVVYSIPMIGFVLFPPVNLILSLAFIFLALKSYRKSKALPEV
jgi:signal peptidase I